MNNQNDVFMKLLRDRPSARADIRGDATHKALRGHASFYTHMNGTFVLMELRGLPNDASECSPNIYATHIHAGMSCEGNMHFEGTGGHYNPMDCPHPAHSGDMPPLFGNRGYALQGFYTERFTPDEVIGRTVIIHEQRDDFTTQPSGDAGLRIGCGVIRKLRLASSL